ncbi:MAG TPA: glycosyl transferase family protein [Candidatus Baltobacteraceae bacterium]|nr:glycosyl transferase family protein [Candidatus Baltobacteraceae bacterium]
MSVFEFTSHLAATIAFLIVASAIAFALMGIDDLLLDLAFWGHRYYRWLVSRRYQPLSLDQLRTKEQQRIAIFIPCWHEHDIVDKMVELTNGSLQYTNYDLFIGVYPNDPLTVEKAKAAAKRFPRTRVVVNSRDGPTTKAQNLNEMWHEMVRQEGDDPYKIVVLHDVEDVIHPVSLLVYNYLIPRRDMVQLPVFPLERPWNFWTTWTYADEFAENHLKDLVARESFGSFVPCAGVGCGFKRESLEAGSAPNGDLFPTESLTEDYQLGLHFRQRGLSTIIVHQRLGLSRGAGKVKSTAAAYVATREFFPDTFGTAIRQKARWIVGICFQAWQQTGWTGGFFTRYTLYRDRKAILANMLVLAGYAVLAATIGLSLWNRADPVDVVTPHIGSKWWPLLVAVLAMTVSRILQKGYFAATIYGPLQGFLAMLRIPWAGIINAFATARACWLFFRSVTTGTKLVWSKTAHVFPTRAALSEYRRQLGDVLIEADLVSNDDVAYALEERKEGERIGETLIRLGYLTQRQLAGAVAKQIGAGDGTRDDLVPTKDALELVTHADALRLRVLPLRVEEDSVTIALDDEPSNELDDFLKKHLPHAYRMLMVEPTRLIHAIERSYAFGGERRKPLGVYLLDRGFLTRSQLETALVQQDRKRKGLFELVVERGYLSPEQACMVMEEYFDLPFVTPPPDVRVAKEYAVKIPTRVLRDSNVVLYESAGVVYVASEFPLDRRSKETIDAAVPAGTQYVAAAPETLAPMRRQILELVERRKQLGQQLVDEKLVTNEDVARALEARAPGERLGETLVRLGILAQGDLRAALARQDDGSPAAGVPAGPAGTHHSAPQRKLIGVYLLEKGYVTREQLDKLLQRQDEVKLPLFAMAVEGKLVTAEQAADVLQDYFGMTYQRPPSNAQIPLEYLKVIPTDLLREHQLAVYQSGDDVFIATPYPISNTVRKTIEESVGVPIGFVACSMEALEPLRRRMLHDIDLYELSVSGSA